MKILIDIGHPAHVHYFRNFINLMTSRGHSFAITARDKEMTFELLERYGIDYFSRGKGGKSLVKKLLYLPKADYKIYKVAKKFKPDLFLSFGSTYAAHTSAILRCPHIALDDTEHAKLELFLYTPFTDTFLNPVSFYKNLGPRQIKFNSLMELSYLHPNFFIPNRDVLRLINISKNESFVIIRFVSWNASHDIGQKGLSFQNKIILVNYLIDLGVKVYISSESHLPPELEKFRITFPSELFHHALCFAKLYIGEGGTTASEAAVLGTPAIYVNTLKMGYITEEIHAGLIFQTTDINKILEIITEILNDNQSIAKFHSLKKEFLSGKIDLTNFLVWFVENYPDSVKTMKNNPDYQQKFN